MRGSLCVMAHVLDLGGYSVSIRSARVKTLSTFLRCIQVGARKDGYRLQETDAAIITSLQLKGNSGKVSRYSLLTQWKTIPSQRTLLHLISGDFSGSCLRRNLGNRNGLTEVAISDPDILSFHDVMLPWNA